MNIAEIKPCSSITGGLAFVYSEEQVLGNDKGFFENEEFLNNLLVLIENVDENGVFQFTTEQKAEIDESIEQIKRGEFETHEEVMNKFLK